jgi:hypothetical protein
LRDPVAFCLCVDGAKVVAVAVVAVIWFTVSCAAANVGDDCVLVDAVLVVELR